MTTGISRWAMGRGVYGNHNVQVNERIPFPRARERRKT